MAITLDYERARAQLDAILELAEADFLSDSPLQPPTELSSACDAIFSSSTQSYREVLLGSIVARCQNREINIRTPYVAQGDDAFNGRTLDERVVNPFLRDNRIPSTGGPYLAVFRRKVRLDASSREGMRDKPGYDALLRLMEHVENLETDDATQDFMRYFLYRFAILRDQSIIPVARLPRVSLEQYRLLISRLLATPSGGRFPMVFATAMFIAMKEFSHPDWAIEFQGINEADRASGAGGDITVSVAGETVLAAEVTERVVDRARVVSTFNNKISVHGIPDYLFLTVTEPDQDARSQAARYFGQGYEVNFFSILDWVYSSLAILGREGRDEFNRVLVSNMERDEVPSAMRQAWNRQLENLTQVGG